MQNNQVMEVLEPRRLLSAGELDAAFGNRGTTSVTFDGSPEYVQMTTQPNGRIVVAVSVFVASTEAYQLELLRFRSDGKPDQTFGEAGRVVVAGAQFGSAPAITSSGRILGSIDGALVRFTSRGRIDRSFGAGGKVKGAGGTFLHALGDGRFLVADGYSLRRYHSDGTLDNSFGKKGIVSIADPSDQSPSFANDLDVQADGKILLTIQNGSGSTTGSIAGGIIRYSPGGKLDHAFGDGGYADVQPLSENVIPIATVITPDGGSVSLVSHEDGGSWLVKLTRDGMLDFNFGEAGVSYVGDFDVNDHDNSFGAGLIRHPNGKLTALFILEESGQAAQYNSDGTLDLGFGGTGKVGVSARFPRDVVLGRNDDLIAATISYNNDDSARLELTAVETAPPVKPRISVSHGRLTINGTSAHDLIDVYGGSDTLFVRLNGEPFKFSLLEVTSLVVNGREGDDSITVTADFDGRVTVNGNGGNDYFEVNEIAPVLNGGSGDDTFIVHTDNAMLFGGSGNDTVSFVDSSRDIVVTLDDLSNDGLPDQRLNVHSDIENIIGGSGNDLFVGDSSANHLYGGPGNDTLMGGSGDDTLEGGRGHDQFLGEKGDDLLIARDRLSDRLDGGEGNDRASVDRTHLAEDSVLNIESFVD